VGIKHFGSDWDNVQLGTLMRQILALLIFAALAQALGVAGNVCPQSVWSGASAAENASIVAGTTVEYYGQVTNLASTAAATVSGQAITQYNAMQAGFANFLLAGGYYWNGLAWAHQ
jgi:hypothetical protein